MSTQYEPGAPVPDGGIPLCVPEIKGNEWKYIRDCLDTNWVSSVGSYVERFEQLVAEYVGARYAIATTSGTAALHVALLVAGVEPDDEVLVSDLTFVAPTNAIRYVGAWPVFIDAEPEYWQIDPILVTDFVEQHCIWRKGQLYNKGTGRRVIGILPVHILGHPVDMDPLIEIAKKYGLAIIEDATESLGAKYRDRSVGILGDISCFSFNGNKLMTTGGGGMILTDHKSWADRARYLTTQAKDDPLEYIHYEIGYNYRLTNIQAAMGCAQMEQLEAFVATKRSNAVTYKFALRTIEGIELMREAPWAYATYWLNTVLVNKKKYGLDSRTLMKLLAKKGIQTRPLWQPMHQSPAHIKSQFFGGSVSEFLNYRALSLPSSVGLSHQDIKHIVSTIREKMPDHSRSGKNLDE